MHRSFRLSFRLASLLAVVLCAACSDSGKLVVILPEVPFWDQSPQSKSAATVGTGTLGQVYSGKCGGFCTVDFPPGAISYAYQGALAPFPIKGTDMVAVLSVPVVTAYGKDGAPTGQPLRMLDLGETVQIVDALGSIPPSLSAVIEGGKVVGYVPKAALKEPAAAATGTGTPVAVAATPAPTPCVALLPTFQPEGGTIEARTALDAHPGKKELVKLADHTLPCAANERDDDCRQVGVDWVFSRPREEGADAEYEVKNLLGGKQAVVVKRSHEVVTPPAGPGARIVWRPAEGKQNGFEAAAKSAGFLVEKSGSFAPGGASSYEIRCPFDPVRAAAGTPTFAIDSSLAPPPESYCSKDEKVSVELAIDGTAEPEAFDARVVSYKFSRETRADRAKKRGTFAIVDLQGGLPLQTPTDVSGPCDHPHYGIGGFHTFFPDGRRLGKAAPIQLTYSANETASLDTKSLALYQWNGDTLDWSYVGGVHDPATRTVKASVDVLSTFTLAPSMPAGAIAVTASRVKDVVQVKTAPLRTNDRKAVPDGTLFTVIAFAPTSDPFDKTFSPFRAPVGQIVQADADAAEEGVQVASAKGVVTFQVKGVTGPLRVVVYSVDGTAVGSKDVR